MRYHQAHDHRTRCALRRLSHSMLVNAPSDFSLAYLRTYFLERGPHDDGADLSLRFPLPRWLIDGVTLEKRVRVALHYGTQTPGNHAFSIGWHPQGNGLLPDFSGTVIATAQTDASCRLAISGTYTPPGGIPGLLFDALVGVRISTATVTALLQDVARRIESDYRVRSIP